jgi:hypothetical protein
MKAWLQSLTHPATLVSMQSRLRLLRSEQDACSLDRRYYSLTYHAALGLTSKQSGSRNAQGAAKLRRPRVQQLVFAQEHTLVS